LSEVRKREGSAHTHPIYRENVQKELKPTC
jgi:hypothetical protein